MKLADAVLSGIRFRRPSTGFWLHPDEQVFLTSTDILATDWYVDEKAVELRATQVREALQSAFRELYSPHSSPDKDMENLVLTKLGLNVLPESADKK